MLTLRHEHFQSDLSPDLAESLFKESITSIELAISSYCNRRCRYCPNYYVDRHSTEHLMADALFDNIIDQLQRIGYSGDLAIHRYNEPFANKTNTLFRIKQIRCTLPDAKIIIFTNGDYLDQPLLRLLADIGVNNIIATLHLDNRVRSFPELKEALQQRVRAFDMPFEFASNQQMHSHHAYAVYHNLTLDYQTIDFWALKENGALCAYDRGGCISTTGSFVRTQPCLMPFVQMQIDYDGTLLPCCNIHPEFEPHQQYVLGKLDETSNIFLAWTNRNYVTWRKELVKTGPKAAPCTYCDMNT